jgi:small subunit ribosomal protein S15
MLNKDKKAKVIKKTAMSDADTGSSAVQVGILSERIKELSAHLKKHKKDNHSRRGLIKLVAKRRKHMKYLEKKDAKTFAKLVKDFKLKG